MRVRNSKTGQRASSKRKLILIVALMMLMSVAVAGTLMFLFDETAPIENKFNPSAVDALVTENFDGTTKSNVNATNTGDIDAYIRIKLVTYRVNEAGERIGGTAEIPGFTLGTGWFVKDGFYYYESPVAPGEEPASDLIDSIDLATYTDADGGKQVIEVMAEAIQAEGMNGSEPIVTSAWGVAVSGGKLAAE